ncbi:DUF924 family protein [Niveispirillum sp. SYP-B3756]|uniref:DUF924 family protein n=1 Tax=Niveispirillum sp. SYP-B3756 TaxID=2662178 RepID=UPI0012912F2E|nr:DUF924 family protein [Niveispirillum sp. SYP-B3756]MQP64191.1 DUF924 family protein [Niveispirillum sp. SYP-B3756]
MDVIGQVLDFWFRQAGPSKWFGGGPDFDQEVAERLGPLHEQAVAGELADWAATAEGGLALCILLDQVPRNIFRGTPRAFASDAQALAIARDLVARGLDMELPDDDRAFLYLPFEHSETMEDQRQSVRLFASRTLSPTYLEYACKHLVVIAEFGRFPHRNAILGRTSTPAELDYLARPGAGF